MKNKEFLKLLKKQNFKSNSGFTLTELLVGLFMSIFVIGAMGFGLTTVLRTTQSETSRVSARNETSRALDFISDEIRRAQAVKTTGAGFVAVTGQTVVMALDIPGFTNDVVYYLQSNSGTNWKGPLVLYRWGPPLGNNGEYTGGGYQPEALIDGIDDTAIASSPCTSPDVLSPPITVASGFYACVNADNTAAQLYLTGETETTLNTEDTYTADTKAVARASAAPANNSSNFVAYTMSYRTLGAVYNCNPSDGSTWKMRTDFGNDPLNLDNTTSWIHQDNRQPQPIEIDTSNDLTITSVPVDPSASTCLSKGDEDATGDANTEALSDYSNPAIFDDGHTVDHTIQFVDPTDPNTANNWHSFNGDSKTGSRDEPDVKGDGTVLMFKNGSTISDSLIGYDYDDNSTGDQDSLGEFLLNKGYATYSGGVYTVANLNSNERIMAVEVGQDDSTHPGFDVQDSIFILSSDVFAQDYD